MSSIPSGALPIEKVSLPDPNKFPVYLIFQMNIIIFGLFALPIVIFFTILNLLFYKFVKKFNLIWSILSFIISILLIIFNFGYQRALDYSKCKGFPSCLVEMPQPWLFYLFVIFTLGLLALPHWFFVWRKIGKLEN